MKVKSVKFNEEKQRIDVVISLPKNMIQRCERCGEPLMESTIVWLEHSNTDGQYYETIPDSHVSQGMFPFGVTCSKKILERTRTFKPTTVPNPSSWMDVLKENFQSIVLNKWHPTHRYYVAINQDEANAFGELVGAQSIVSRTDGAFDILVLSTGSY